MISGLLGVQSGCAINKIVQLPASNSCYNHRAAMRLFGRQQACVCVGMWRSLVARLLWEQDVAGSNPVIPTIFASSLLTQRRTRPMLRFRHAPGLALHRFPSRPEGRSAAVQHNSRHLSAPRRLPWANLFYKMFTLFIFFGSACLISA